MREYTAYLHERDPTGLDELTHAGVHNRPFQPCNWIERYFKF